jgi:hypothetical protein
MNRSTLRAMVTMTAGALVALAAASSVSAWDSRRFARQPVHPTHSYLTEWGIDQLAAGFPELNQFRAEIIEGANQELHELPLKNPETLHGVDLEAKRIQHKGTNKGCDDTQGWWQDAQAAYKAGNKPQAYFLLGILLHMIQDMGVPAHANRVYHQGTLTEFDNFEFLALSNWKPSFDDINRKDPGYAEPWRYYSLSQEWTHADAPDYRNRDSFSKTWLLASKAEKALLSNRQGRTCHVVMWALRSASNAFKKP